MALIPKLSDIPDLTPVAEGEYDLRVIKAKESASKNTGRNSIMLICEIVDEDNAQNLIHSLWLPMESDDTSKQQTMWRMIKDFVVAIGLDPDEDIEAEDFDGMEFSAYLLYEDDEDYGPRNTIKRIV